MSCLIVHKFLWLVFIGLTSCDFFLCRECRKNEPIYKAIQGQKKWNLTEKFSVKDVRNFL